MKTGAASDFASTKWDFTSLKIDVGTRSVRHNRYLANQLCKSPTFRNSPESTPKGLAKEGGGELKHRSKMHSASPTRYAGDAD